MPPDSSLEPIIETNADGDVTWMNPPEGGQPLIFSKAPFYVTYLEVEDLELTVQLTPAHADEGRSIPLRQYSTLTGRAKLMDSSVEVLGYPFTESNTVQISFEVFDERHEVVHNALEGRAPPQVSLNYTGADWQAGIAAQWNVTVGLRQEEFAYLESGITRGATRLAVRASFEKLYADASTKYGSGRLSGRTVLLATTPRYLTAFSRGELSSITLRGPTLFAPSASTGRLQTENEPEVGPKPGISAEELSLQPVTSDAPLRKIQSTLQFIGWTLLVLAAVLLMKMG